MLNQFMIKRSHLNATFVNCDAACSQIRDLEKHIKSVHEGKKPFKCNNCDASFTTKQFQEKKISKTGY